MKRSTYINNAIIYKAFYLYLRLNIYSRFSKINQYHKHAQLAFMAILNLNIILKVYFSNKHPYRIDGY